MRARNCSRLIYQAIFSLRKRYSGNKLYFSYILLGALYFISKVLFYIPGWVCTKGVVLGAIATVATVCVGILAFKEHRGKRKQETGAVMHWFAILIPLFILFITPNYMLHKIYSVFEMFNISKVVIFKIFEFLAIAQVILAVLMFRDRSRV